MFIFCILSLKPSKFCNLIFLPLSPKNGFYESHGIYLVCEVFGIYETEREHVNVDKEFCFDKELFDTKSLIIKSWRITTSYFLG